MMYISDEKIWWTWFSAMLGRPYIWGGDDPMRGYDCSGLVQDGFAMFGMDDPQDSTADKMWNQWDQGYADSKRVPSSRLGDIIFFGKPERASHVAIAVNHRTMFHAGGGRQTTIDHTQSIAQNAFVKFAPIDSRLDKLGIYRPERWMMSGEAVFPSCKPKK